MKFGKTLAEKRLHEDALKQPHKWFAWYPIKEDSGKWVWLEFVTRRFCSWGEGYRYWWVNEKQ